MSKREERILHCEFSMYRGGYVLIYLDTRSCESYFEHLWNSDFVSVLDVLLFVLLFFPSYKNSMTTLLLDQREAMERVSPHVPA